MATSQPTIKAALLVLYNSAKASEMTETEYADEMATIIQNAIQSGSVTVNTAVNTIVTTPDTVNGTGTGNGVTTIGTIL